MSLIHRVSILVKLDDDPNPRTCYCIVKEKSDEAFGAALMDVLSVFEKERDVYENLLPSFERLWAARGRPEVRFGPKLLKCTDGPEFTVIVMEDLTRSQFRMRDQPYNLPLLDMKRILSKLAKFHATSLVHCERAGAFSGHFLSGVITEHTVELLKGYYEVLFRAFVQSLRERQFPDQYLTPLASLEDRLLTECCQLYKVDNSELNVLNHGDLWPNNVMFGDDDLLFLDYATVFYSSFAGDLLYVFATSCAELICDSLDALLEHYYGSLAESFDLLGSSRALPSTASLTEQLKRRGVLILPTLTEALAISMAKLTETNDLQTVISDSREGEALRRRVFNNPAFVALIDRLVPTLFEKGFFSSLKGAGALKSL
ncbi:uncharacterized protein LOC131210494 [Anopheles bellator]|uniref:uncharacterized protein LOC131210494 n=1 Tax=Anopheles bellator TaxID=139047 RepID=UPI0026490A43|nr:uncharacterized protein LOC131210494 [Anopheles bellator]